MIFIDHSPSLSHYGVLGMKWGVRKDGMPQGYQGSGNGHKPSKTEKKAAKEQQKRIKEFNDNYNKNWTKTYNKAADKNAKDLERINKKYKSYDFSKIDLSNPSNNSAESIKAWNKYVQELDTAWRKNYSEVLLEDFGTYPDPEIGEEWVWQAPFMNDFKAQMIEE